MQKTVLVTGASNGIGKAIALAFGRLKYNVAVNFNKSEQSASKVVCAINADGGRAIGIKADVSSVNQVKSMINEIKSSFGDIDILVNNAGIAYQGLVTDMTDEQYRNVMSTNFDSVFYCCREVLPMMIKHHTGRIINIASVWGECGASCEVVYSASKAAVIGFTKALAQEVGPCNITVNCVSPGIIDTKMNDIIDKDILRQLADELPLGRVGLAHEVADAVLFLASDNAAYITGQTLSVNGGEYCR